MIVFKSDCLTAGTVDDILDVIESRDYSSEIRSLNNVIESLDFTKSSTNQYLHLGDENVNFTSLAFSQLCRILGAPPSYLSGRTSIDLLKADLSHDLEQLGNCNKSILFSNSKICSVNGENYPRIPNHSLLLKAKLTLEESTSIENIQTLALLKNEEMSLFLKLNDNLNYNGLVPCMKITHSEAGTGPLQVYLYYTYEGLGILPISNYKSIIRKCHVGDMKLALDTLSYQIQTFNDIQDIKDIDPDIYENISQLNKTTIWNTFNEGEEVINKYFHKNPTLCSQLKTNIKHESTLREFLGLWHFTLSANNNVIMTLDESAENFMINLIKDVI